MGVKKLSYKKIKIIKKFSGRKSLHEILKKAVLYRIKNKYHTI